MFAEIRDQKQRCRDQMQRGRLCWLALEGPCIPTLSVISGVGSLGVLPVAEPPPPAKIEENLRLKGSPVSGGGAVCPKLPESQTRDAESENRAT